MNTITGSGLHSRSRATNGRLARILAIPPRLNTMNVFSCKAAASFGGHGGTHERIPNIVRHISDALRTAPTAVDMADRHGLSINNGCRRHL